jgi:miniconductance mechanosensitive channel
MSLLCRIAIIALKLIDIRVSGPICKVSGPYPWRRALPFFLTKRHAGADVNLFDDWQYELGAHPWIGTVAGLAGLLLAAFLAHFLVRLLLGAMIRRALKKKMGRDDSTVVRGAVGRIVWFVPALIIHGGITFVPGLPMLAVSLIRNAMAALMVVSVMFAISTVLDAVNSIYQRRPEARARPIKGYIQVVKIALYIASAVLVIAVVMEQSPLLLLSGLGAMAAVLMLVFKDTILSLVASVQLTSNDMLRVGDWIEMPSAGADGDVVDIALHTVKVQNWDKTITTIPTWKLISESFRNWRGMSESGGRRIKRSLSIDMNSVRFLSKKDHERLGKLALLSGYLDAKDREVAEWNARLGEAARAAVNTRRLTNIGTFRAYVVEYLQAHADIANGMTQLVRQLQPTRDGLPLEIYCFTNTTAWGAYENIQSDIFDHLLAVMPEFGLRLHQTPAGADIADLGQSLHEQAA